MAAALASERLGLPHNPPIAVARTRDKSAMRQALAREAIPQPAFALVEGGDDATAAVEQVGLPCVVKPVSLSASRGVIRANDLREVHAAVARVRAILDAAGRPADEPLLVEGYVPGAEVAVEALLRDGVLEVLAIFDKPDPLEGPFFEETLYVTPSRLPEAVLGEIERVTASAARALGLREGPVHAELRIHAGQPWMLELAARSIGGLCSRALRFGAGMSLEAVILRHALGLPLGDRTRERAASGVMMLPISRAGILVAVDGQARARAVDGIGGLDITIARGRPVVPLPEGDRYLGFLFARGADAEAVERALREAHGELRVRIAPPAGVGTPPTG
jgi:biotin carboxylase